MAFEVHCVPVSGTTSVAPCQDVDGVSFAPAMIEYSVAQYDYAAAAEFFAWSLSAVLICWIIGLVTGNVIRVIRSV